LPNNKIVILGVWTSTATTWREEVQVEKRSHIFIRHRR